jgi:hypothetical protein
VKIPIHLNMAACQLRIKDYHTCIYNCTEVGGPVDSTEVRWLLCPSLLCSAYLLGRATLSAAAQHGMACLFQQQNEPG